ncbi:hypothetical protein BKA63DRAFT_585972 [Paraphoma chrysanthemicola]|nr:hypothetical protein BKA63DRAFT_585972 [Paraphoma chrysanthemicola]
MPAKPSTKTPTSLYRKRLICSSLALICLILANTIFALSTRAFLPQRHTTSPLHLAFFIASCAPLCTYLGILCGWLYYRRKRNKYGRYEATMRRQGRGYWIDPSDAEDKRKQGQGNVMWAEEPRKEDFEDDGWGKERIEDLMSMPAPLAETATTTFKRLTNLNPFGWGVNNEHRPRTAYNPPINADNHRGNDIELGSIANVREPERAMSRTDSIRSAKDDPVVERGVVDIWLSGKRGSGSIYGSRRGRGW